MIQNIVIVNTLMVNHKTILQTNLNTDELFPPYLYIMALSYFSHLNYSCDYSHHSYYLQAFIRDLSILKQETLSNAT